MAALWIAVVAAVPAAAARDTASAGPVDFVAGSLAGGGRYVVRPSSGAPVAAVELWFRAPATGFEAPVPGLAHLAAATVSASVPITGTQLGAFVEQLGGRIGIATYPDSIAVSTLVPSAKAPDVVRAMTAAFFAPVISPAGLGLAKADLAESEGLRSFDSDTMVRDSLVSQLFGDGPAHYPMLGAPGSLANVTIEQVRSYAMRAFRAQNAVLVVTGSVDAGVVASAVPGRAVAAGTSAAAPEPNVSSSVSLPGAPVAKTAFESGFGLGWVGPSISEESEATTLDFVADYLFRPETGVLSRLLTDEVSLTGQFVTYHDPGIMIVTATGAKAEGARPIVELELNRLQQPLPAATFAAARDAFIYHILSDLQTPPEIADTFGWYSVEGSPDYAPGAGGLHGKYFESAASLTPAAVAATVRKYLSRTPASVTLSTRKPAVEKKS